jgi:hypothetical protein
MIPSESRTGRPGNVFFSARDRDSEIFVCKRPGKGKKTEEEHANEKAEDERGTRGQCILARRRLTLAFWCKKGSLEYSCPRTHSSHSGVDGKAHCGLTYGIG